MKPLVIVDKDKCDGCGLCVEVCPTSVFELKNGKAEVVDQNKCMLCYGCMPLCPREAIKVEDQDP